MTDLFLKAVRTNGSTAKIATYPSGDTTRWGEVMRGFVGGTMRGKTPVPTSTFQAAFIPDSWKNLELLVPLGAGAFQPFERQCGES